MPAPLSSSTYWSCTCLYFPPCGTSRTSLTEAVRTTRTMRHCMRRVYPGSYRCTYAAGLQLVQLFDRSTCATGHTIWLNAHRHNGSCLSIHSFSSRDAAAVAVSRHCRLSGHDVLGGGRTLFQLALHQWHSFMRQSRCATLACFSSISAYEERYCCTNTNKSNKQQQQK
jgi:hypothetical protein